MKVIHSCLTLATPWTVACQTPLSMGFSRQEYWSGLPFPSPEDISNLGIKRKSPALQADSLPTELWGKLPASWSFQMSQFFVSGGQSIGVQHQSFQWILKIDLLRMVWLDLLAVQRLSRVFSNTTVQKYQFFSAQLSLQPNSHIHTWLLEKPKLWLDGPLLAASGILLKFEFYHMAHITSLSVTPQLSQSQIRILIKSYKVSQDLPPWPLCFISFHSPPLTHSAPATLVWTAGQKHQAHFWQPLLKAFLLQSVSLTL